MHLHAPRSCTYAVLLQATRQIIRAHPLSTILLPAAVVFIILTALGVLGVMMVGDTQAMSTGLQPWLGGRPSPAIRSRSRLACADMFVGVAENPSSPAMLHAQQHAQQRAPTWSSAAGWGSGRGLGHMSRWTCPRTIQSQGAQGRLLKLKRCRRPCRAGRRHTGPEPHRLGRAGSI